MSNGFYSPLILSELLLDQVLIRRFIESTPEFADRKFSLKELFTKVEQVGDEVQEYLSSSVVWHRLEKIKPMYKNTLGINFPDNLGKIFRAINLRHDIIHRNGKLKSGEKIKINERDINELIEEIQGLVDYLDSQIVSMRDNQVNDFVS